MSWVETLSHLARSPDMVLSVVNFDTAVSFVNGYDTACEGIILDGFREWLLPQVDFGETLAWSELALWHAFPNLQPLKHRPRDFFTEDEKSRLFDHLIRLLTDFTTLRRQRNGLRKIMANFENWLHKQQWFNENSPDWIAKAIEKKPRRK